MAPGLAGDVQAGRLTDAQRDEIVAGLPARVKELVDRTLPPWPDRDGDCRRARRGTRAGRPEAARSGA